jgi:hypothetical protein
MSFPETFAFSIAIPKRSEVRLRVQETSIMKNYDLQKFFRNTHSHKEGNNVKMGRNPREHQAQRFSTLTAHCDCLGSLQMMSIALALPQRCRLNWSGMGLRYWSFLRVHHDSNKQSHLTQLSHISLKLWERKLRPTENK